MDTGARNYQLFLSGDDEAMVDIIRDYQDGLILFLNRYTGNISEAEELAEDTFFRLVTKKPRFSPRYSFKTWLYTIARNLAVSHLRRRARQGTLNEQVQDPQAEEALEQKVYLEERSQILYKALGHLRPDYCEVLSLKYLEELDNKQVAKIMGKSCRQVENLAYQAKRALRAVLEQEGIHAGLS